MQAASTPIITCAECGKQFSHHSSLSRHTHRFCCVLKNKSINQKQQREEKIKNEGIIIELHDLIRDLKNEISNVTRSTGSVNIQNNNNNTLNVTINQFGKEDLSDITNLDLDRILYRTKLGLVQLMEHIHFREKIRKEQ